MVPEQEREMEDKLLLRRDEANIARNLGSLFCFYRKMCIRTNEYLLNFLDFGLVKKRIWCYNSAKVIQLSHHLR